jgi:hypothetical protein
MLRRRLELQSFADNKSTECKIYHAYNTDHPHQYTSKNGWRLQYDENTKMVYDRLAELVGQSKVAEIVIDFLSLYLPIPIGYRIISPWDLCIPLRIGIQFTGVSRDIIVGTVQFGIVDNQANWNEPPDPSKADKLELIVGLEGKVKVVTYFGVAKLREYIVEEQDLIENIFWDQHAEKPDLPDGLDKLIMDQSTRLFLALTGHRHPVSDNRNYGTHDPSGVVCYDMSNNYNRQSDKSKLDQVLKLIDSAKKEKTHD